MPGPTRAPPDPSRCLLPVHRLVQRDDVSCGPTCLAMVCRSFGDRRGIAAYRGAVHNNPDGGTLAVHLGNAALALGFRATLMPMGVKIFDPTWWHLRRDRLIDKLRQRAAWLGEDSSEAFNVQAWRRFLEAGGGVQFHELTPELLVRSLDLGRPVIAGLNATWLYREPRERPHDNEPDDIQGRQVGHFAVVMGYSGRGLHFHVRDPHPDAPYDGARRAPLSAARLLSAILLGDHTDDAVLLEIHPEGRSHA